MAQTCAGQVGSAEEGGKIMGWKVGKSGLPEAAVNFEAVGVEARASGRELRRGGGGGGECMRGGCDVFWSRGVGRALEEK